MFSYFSLSKYQQSDFQMIVLEEINVILSYILKFYLYIQFSNQIQLPKVRVSEVALYKTAI